MEQILHLLNEIPARAYILLGVNLLLFAFAGKLLSRFTTDAISEDQKNTRINAFRSVNSLCIVMIVLTNIFASNGGTSDISKAIRVLMILYAGFLANYLFAYVIHAKFGRRKEKQIIETYNSRVLKFLATILLALITFVACVQSLGLSGLLETGGQ